MKLSEIIKDVRPLQVAGTLDVDITGINIDSRLVKRGELFVAMRGTQTDGHDYIPKAIGQGAAAVLCEEIPADVPDGVTFVKVQNCEDVVGLAATTFYGNPTARLKLVEIGRAHV